MILERRSTLKYFIIKNNLIILLIIDRYIQLSPREFIFIAEEYMLSDLVVMD